jgi:UDP-3-O-[3-hydroxymyristoyl] glucosamine N-acyltransferase
MRHADVHVTLADIVANLGGQLIGSPTTRIKGIRSLDAANETDIAFLSNAKYASQLQTTHAACVIVAPQFADASNQRFASIVADDPYLYFAKLTQWWKKKSIEKSGELSKPQIHPSCVIGQDVQIAADAKIGPLCVIEDGVVIGARTVLKARVTVGEGCQIGYDCLIHSGVVIGADGFGFAPDKSNGEWIKIEQLGNVRIGNYVEIGANTCIDRGALEDTVIEDGVKLDNLIQIGHNVHIGKHSALAGCVGVAGSAKIGSFCTIGGGAIVLGHLSLADHVHISAASVVMRSIIKPGNYTGIFPLDDNESWEKNAATLKQLHNLRDRMKRLEQT